MTVSKVEIFASEKSKELFLPFVSDGISAGFPSPALDFIEQRIDINQHLIKHPSTTFFGRVKGWSMKDLGISDGDLLVIDKSIEARNGKVAVCYLDGEFTLKKIKLDRGRLLLIPANEEYQPIEVNTESDFIVWGIVVYVIKAF